jgi:AcrR family transcriptional regulator
MAMQQLTESQIQLPIPKRADARRNFEKLLAAGRHVFREAGASAPLEAVADRAGVGIGTLYRHFPTRRALLEAVYLDEVEALARAAEELSALAPWEALTEWLGRYVAFAATKRALTEALLEESETSQVLGACRGAILTAGSGLLQRAQEAGVVRSDVIMMDVMKMVGGIALMPTADPNEKERMLSLALDGLRYRPAAR